jgi:DNA-binding ferritin-like protein (Dps family)
MEETEMNFIQKITGSDMTKIMKEFEARAKVLPAEYQTAWKEMMRNLWIHGDFTGRNLMPILDSALELLEVTSADGQSVEEVLGDDIKGFCAALVGDEGAKSYRDKWREQLNKNVARKLGGLK